MAERQSIIEDGLEGFEAKKYLQAYLVVNDRSGDLGGITSGDPIPSLLLLRCADEAVRVGLNQLVAEPARFLVFQLIEANRSAASGWSTMQLRSMMQDLDDAGPAGSEEFKRLYDTTRYFRQYSLFRSIGQNLSGDTKSDRELSDWRSEKLDSFNDYTNVHPFAIALCPPHHIWSRFIFDGDLCEVQSDGTLKRTPLELCDSAKTAEPQKHYPFLHISNDTETYPPMKS